MIRRRAGGVLLVLAEASWGSLLLAALADGSSGPGRPAVDLPFLALAVPAVAAVVVAALLGGRRTRLGRWAPALAAASVLAALTVELVASLTPGFAPWGPVDGLVAQRAMSWAVAVAVLAWGRGTWLGLVPPSVRQAAASTLIGLAVLVELLVQRAAGHSPAFGRATADAGWMLVVFFVSAVSAVAWAHMASVERVATRRIGAGPGSAWVVATAVPFVAVAVLALVVGGAGGVVGPGATVLARDVGRVFTWLATWIYHRLSHLSFHFRRPSTSAGATLGRQRTQRSNGVDLLLDILGVALEVLITLVVVGAIGLAASWVVRRLRQRKHQVATDDERESVFTWAHLMAQLGAALSRLGRRVRLWMRRAVRSAGGDEVTGGLAPAVLQPEPDVDPVRAAYRRFLVAARSATVGRAPSETPRELAGRLALDPQPLRLLTGVYEQIRYAETSSPGAAAPGIGEPAAAFEAAAIVAAIEAAGELTRALGGSVGSGGDGDPSETAV
jgi:hypothetical protein